MDYPSTYPLCPFTQINVHVFVLKPTQLNLNSPSTEKIFDSVLTVFLFNLLMLTVKGLSILKVQLVMVI